MNQWDSLKKNAVVFAWSQRIQEERANSLALLLISWTSRRLASRLLWTEEIFSTPPGPDTRPWHNYTEENPTFDPSMIKNCWISPECWGFAVWNSRPLWGKGKLVVMVTSLSSSGGSWSRLWSLLRLCLWLWWKRKKSEALFFRR